MAHVRKTFGQRQSGLAPSYRSGAYAPAYNAGSASFVPSPAQGSYSPGYDVSNAATDTVQSINTGQSRTVTWMRYLSGFIDYFILCFLSVFVIMLFGVSVNTAEVLGSGLAGLLLLALFALWFGYGLVFELSSWQATPGKKITGLIVTDEYGDRLTFGRALGRAMGKILSGCVPLYLSYIMMHWTQKNKTLHDMMAGTRVYKRRDLGGNVGGYFD